jgi:hypothetical protein
MADRADGGCPERHPGPPERTKLTVGEWRDSWLAGYGTVDRPPCAWRGCTFARIGGRVRGSADGRGAAHGRAGMDGEPPPEDVADSYVYALHNRLPQLMSAAVYDGLLARNPCSRRTSTSCAGWCA